MPEEKDDHHISPDSIDDDDDVLPEPVNRRDARIRVMTALYAGEIGERTGDVDIDLLSDQLVGQDLAKRPDLLEFARNLLRNAWNNRERCDDMIRLLAKNWDFNRIAPVDKAVLRMGLAELLYFPDIPTRVSINESIEIAKTFSTDKSGVFVNGILDAAVSYLRENEQLVKSGRGLIGE